MRSTVEIEMSGTINIENRVTIMVDTEGTTLIEMAIPWCITEVMGQDTTGLMVDMALIKVIMAMGGITNTHTETGDTATKITIIGQVIGLANLNNPP